MNSIGAHGPESDRHSWPGMGEVLTEVWKVVEVGEFE